MTGDVAPHPDARRRLERAARLTAWIDRVGWGAGIGMLLLTLAPILWILGMLLRGCGD